MKAAEDVSKPGKDMVPDNFATLDEAAKFCDSHDLADYWDEIQEVEFEVHIQRRHAIFLAMAVKE